MRVTINDREVNIPSSLSEITLQQRIDFQKEQGDLMDQMLKSIQEMPEGFEKDAEYNEYVKKKQLQYSLFIVGLN